MIMPCRDLAEELTAAVAGAVQKIFGFATAFGPLLTDLAFAFDAAREQYHSTPILKRLADDAPEWALKIIALVEVDLFIPILTHVYGEAQLGGKACIVSSYRLNERILAAQCQREIPAADDQGIHPRTGAHLQPPPLPRSQMHHALLPQRGGCRPEIGGAVPLLPHPAAR
ncbi:MAG: hypothetical protein MZV70_61350 [Desulfobacterales bacterium]|nr:hypothetical protein [Desulfobacterales bacterium]